MKWSGKHAGRKKRLSQGIKATFKTNLYFVSAFSLNPSLCPSAVIFTTGTKKGRSDTADLIVTKYRFVSDCSF
jgi:hypothetical protein